MLVAQDNRSRCRAGLSVHEPDVRSAGNGWFADVAAVALSDLLAKPPTASPSWPGSRSDRIVSGLRRRFGISAPKLAVPPLVVARQGRDHRRRALLVLAGLFYGGFDAGRIFAGFNVGKVKEEQDRLAKRGCAR